MVEDVKQQLANLGLDDELPPPEAASAPLEPPAVPATDSDRRRAYLAAQGLNQTLKLLHQAAGEALEASNAMMEAMASRPEAEPEGEE